MSQLYWTSQMMIQYTSMIPLIQNTSPNPILSCIKWGTTSNYLSLAAVPLWLACTGQAFFWKKTKQKKQIDFSTQTSVTACLRHLCNLNGESWECNHFSAICSYLHGIPASEDARIQTVERDVHRPQEHCLAGFQEHQIFLHIDM